ncbi:MAG: hypothetical protein WKF47_01360 [Geodermatophilaceae bacterium]
MRQLTQPATNPYVVYVAAAVPSAKIVNSTLSGEITGRVGRQALSSSLKTNSGCTVAPAMRCASAMVPGADLRRGRGVGGGRPGRLLG